MVALDLDNHIRSPLIWATTQGRPYGGFFLSPRPLWGRGGRGEPTPHLDSAELVAGNPLPFERGEEEEREALLVPKLKLLGYASRIEKRNYSNLVRTRTLHHYGYSNSTIKNDHYD